ncbi:glucose-1-phosphate adenylyltransferase [soil metagenome]
MPKVLSLILGGGRGTRLFPLTKQRAKPAVPVAGKYRLIDIPISNCINSRLNRIYVLTQFLSVSLHRHIANTYKFDMFSNGFVEILAAQQGYDENVGWYQGTADAVRQNLPYIEQEQPDEVLILSGDQLYRMDYQDLLATHRKSGADVTLACLPVPENQTSGFGLMRVDNAGQVQEFAEKPKTAEARKPFHTPTEWIEERGIPCLGRNYLANMGIYVFKTDKLIEMLNTPVYDKLLHTEKLPHDFGSNIFPSHVGKRHIHAHLFDGFWEDLGTIKSYHDVSLALAEPSPPFNFFQSEGMIFTRMRNLPASRFDGTSLSRVSIADGCIIGTGSSIEHSMIGVRCVVGRNVMLKDVVCLGSDKFESPKDLKENAQQNRPDLNIGDGSRIERAILDKDCRVGKNVTIRCQSGKPDFDDPAGRYFIRDGLVCIPRAGVIPEGLTI